MTTMMFLLFIAFGMALAALAVTMSGVTGFALAGIIVIAGASGLVRSRGEA